MIDPVALTAINRLVDIIDVGAWQGMDDEAKLGYIRRYIGNADELNISPKTVDDVLQGVINTATVHDDVFAETSDAVSLASRLATAIMRATALRTVLIDGYRVIVGRMGNLTLSGRIVAEDHRQVSLAYVRVAMDAGGEEYTRMCASIAKNEADYDRIVLGGDEDDLLEEEEEGAE